jgi:hypothetical protein
MLKNRNLITQYKKNKSNFTQILNATKILLVIIIIKSN